MQYIEVEALVGRKLDEFKGSREISDYARKKYVHLATNMTYDYAMQVPVGMDWKIEDFVHGLTHIFFDGIIEGMTVVLHATREGE